jgi:hypothetical protein
VGDKVSLGSGGITTSDTSMTVGTNASQFNAMYATTFYGKATQAQYADLAERFEADAYYVPGTVVRLGGEKEITKEKNQGESGKETEKPSSLKGAVLERLSTMFLPEFLNRLDDIIIFQPLKPEELRKICDIMINEVAKRVEKKQIMLLLFLLKKRKNTTELTI